LLRASHGRAGFPVYNLYENFLANGALTAETCELRRSVGEHMFVLSCFIVGYLIARALRAWGRVPIRLLVALVIGVLAIFAIAHVVYEFWAPWPGYRDYGFYRTIVTGRHRVPLQSGLLAFLLGFVIYLLRARVLDTLRKAGLVPNKPDQRPRARGFP